MSELTMLPIDCLEHHPKNPRKQIGDVTELAQSIRESGILQNLTVVQHLGEITGNPTGFYWVVIGNRRLEAAKLAGLTEVPCAVVEMSETEQFRTMMVENMQRSDLTVLEEADGFQLMLDMGSTVAEISQQTGISETKIRNRVKLTKLDRKAAAEGFKRGARLEDYLKLEKIKDEAARNKVLEAIGTSNFNERYSAAINRQNNLEHIYEVRQKILDMGFAKEVKQIPGDGWTYQGNYGCWNKSRPVTRPKDAGSREYRFRVCTESSWPEVCIYRKDLPQDVQEAEKSKRDQVLSDLRTIEGELKEEHQRFKALREEFIKTFSRFDRYREEIMAMAGRTFMQPRTGYGESWVEEACEALGIQWDENRDHPEKVQLADMCRKQPEKVLLFMSYYRLESETMTPYCDMWDGDLKVSYPTPRESKGLSKLYSLLADLGYETSTEEDLFMRGAGMQYQEAKAVVAKAREELGI